ncbi:putative ABC1 protein [Capsicum annuum]|nr:putative ABC1 protein [Capsicum annuum]
MKNGMKNYLGGWRKPQLILLDHGLYKELDYHTRINYAALWKALVYSDANGIKDKCVKLGAGDDLYALFAGILTMRPWNKVIDPSVDHLVVNVRFRYRSVTGNTTVPVATGIPVPNGPEFGTDSVAGPVRPGSTPATNWPVWNNLKIRYSDSGIPVVLVPAKNSGKAVPVSVPAKPVRQYWFRSVATLGFYCMYASQYFSQITELLRRLPRVILLMLKTNDCLRAVNGSLIKRPSLESFLIIGRVSSEAVLESLLSQKKSLLSWINFWVQKILLKGRLCIMHIALWLLQLQKTLTL